MAQSSGVNHLTALTAPEAEKYIRASSKSYLKAEEVQRKSKISNQVPKLLAKANLGGAWDLKRSMGSINGGDPVEMGT